MMEHVASRNAISRRAILRGAPLVAATAVALDGVTTGVATAQQPKLSQALSKYQDSPKNGQQCSTCSHFVAPSSCTIVVDPITAQGWCQFFMAKAA